MAIDFPFQKITCSLEELRSMLDPAFDSRDERTASFFIILKTFRQREELTQEIFNKIFSLYSLGTSACADIGNIYSSTNTAQDLSETELDAH